MKIFSQLLDFATAEVKFQTFAYMGIGTVEPIIFLRAIVLLEWQKTMTLELNLSLLWKQNQSFVSAVHYILFSWTKERFREAIARLIPFPEESTPGIFAIQLLKSIDGTWEVDKYLKNIGSLQGWPTKQPATFPASYNA